MQAIHIPDIAEELALQYNPQNLTPFPYESVDDDTPDLMFGVSDLKGHVSGYIKYDEEEQMFHIIVNHSLPVHRRNFTFALAYGHYFLHRDKVMRQGCVYIHDLSIAQGQELHHQIQQAFEFAMGLLLPKKLAVRSWNIFEDVQKCAAVFKVPTFLMRARLQYLNVQV